MWVWPSLHFPVLNPNQLVPNRNLLLKPELDLNWQLLQGPSPEWLEISLNQLERNLQLPLDLLAVTLRDESHHLLLMPAISPL
jgi:hypothetical protein